MSRAWPPVLAGLLWSPYGSILCPQDAHPPPAKRPEHVASASASRSLVSHICLLLLGLWQGLSGGRSAVQDAHPPCCALEHLEHLEQVGRQDWGPDSNEPCAPRGAMTTGHSDCPRPGCDSEPFDFAQGHARTGITCDSLSECGAAAPLWVTHGKRLIPCGSLDGRTSPRCRFSGGCGCHCRLARQCWGGEDHGWASQPWHEASKAALRARTPKG